MEIENLNLQRQIDELSNWQNTFLDTIYPIGSIYMSIDSTNPSSLFGGAWEPWGTGKVPVGVDLNDTDFNTVEKTGGEKTHTLSVNEMPTHKHSFAFADDNGTAGIYDTFQYNGWRQARLIDGTMDNTGGSQAHNNLQPYITCYMWKRITPSYTLEYTDKDSTSHSETILTEEELKARIQELKTVQEGQTVYMNLKTCKIISNGIKIKDCSNLFENCQGVTQIDLSDFDTSETTTMKSMFYACNSLQEINLNGINTSKVINMSLMFSSCHNLKSIDLSNFDTGNVTNMNSMFTYCTSLNTLDLSNFDTSNVTNMESMFGNVGMQNVDISNLDTSNVKNMRGMFANSQWLISLNLSNFNTSNVTDMSWMFNNCFDLETLDISNFDFSNVTDSEKMFNAIPSDCLITVKDQTAKNFILSVRSDFTNIEIANNQE